MGKYLQNLKSVLALLILIGIIVSCSNTNTKHSVQYKVSSDIDRPVDITMETGDGTSTQHNGIQTPYSSESMEFKSGAFTYVSAQNQTSRGTIHVSIMVDGKVFKTSTCTGEYCIASASGAVE